MSKSTPEKPTFQPILIHSRDGLVATVNAVVADKLKLKALEVALDREVAELTKRYQRQMESLGRNIAAGEAGIEVYFSAHREELLPEKVKSLDLQLAVLGFRDTPHRVEKARGKDTWDDIALRAASYLEVGPAEGGEPLITFSGGDYVRLPAPELDKKALLADRETLVAQNPTFLKTIGIKFDYDELFYFEPKSKNIEGVTAEAKGERRMTTVTLDMAVGAAAAQRQWEALPDTAPKPQRDAYWRRYSLLRDAEAAGTPLLDIPEVSYLATGTAPAKAAAPTPSGPSSPSSPSSPQPHKPMPKNTATAEPANEPQFRPLLPKEIVPRLLQVIEQTGHHVRGGQAALMRRAGLNTYAWHTALRAQKAVSPEFVDAFATATGARLEYLVNGELPAFEKTGKIDYAPESDTPVPAVGPKNQKPKKPKVTFVRTSGPEIKAALARGATPAPPPVFAPAPAPAATGPTLSLDDALAQLPAAVSALGNAKARVRELTAIINTHAA